MTKTFKPKLGGPPLHLTQPKIQVTVSSRSLSFGFRYLRQIEKFGLQGQTISWPSSLLDRLAQLCNESWDELISNPAKAQAQRFHEVDWTLKNVPLKRSDLDWLPRDYLNDEEEYPLFQFQVSLALGRFAGFRDESGVFQIVLLDPLHNLQPSSVFDYRVRPADPVRNEFEALRAKIDSALSKSDCEGKQCAALLAFRRSQFDEHCVMVARLDQGNRELAQELIDSGKRKSLSDIFEDGLLSSMD